MEKKGYCYNQKQVKAKLLYWETRYKAIRDNGTGGNKKVFKYYDVMHRVFGKQSKMAPHYLTSGDEIKDSRPELENSEGEILIK